MNEGFRSYRGKVLLLSIACIVSNISYYPVFVSNGYGRIASIICWLGLLVFALFKRINMVSELGTFTVLYALFVVNTIIVGLMNGVNAFGNHFFQTITIAFVIYLISNLFGAELDIYDLRMICIAYYYCMVVISVLLFFFYLRGTDLSTSMYGYRYGKNEIASLLLCSFIIGFVVYNPKSRVKRILRLASIVLFITDILLLRTRSAMLGIGFLGLVLMVKAKRFRKSARYFGIASIIVITGYLVTHISVLEYFLNTFVFAGRNANSFSELSSGRDIQVALAMETFGQNVLFGVGDRGTCDSFYPSVLANYGLFGWPLIVMSLLPVIWSVRNIKLYDYISLCFFLVASSFFILSLFEELAPFGSGARCYLLWLMWGILVQNKSIDGKNGDLRHERNRP